MSNSSFLGAERAPVQAEGRDVDALGPSDTSDSGSDVQGSIDIDAADELGNLGQADHFSEVGDSDASGTGERGSALLGEHVRDGDDIMPDHIAGDEDDDALASAELDGVDDLPDDLDDVEGADDAIDATSDPIS